MRGRCCSAACFKALETPQKLFASLGAAKLRHNADDMRRAAAVRGVQLNMPAGHPLRTVEALRALLVVGRPYLGPLAHAFYRAYWVDGIDIGTPEGIGSRAERRAGMMRRR